MKKLLLYVSLPFLFTAISSVAKSQLLYNSSSIGTRIYNPGFGKNNTPIILFDDINFPSTYVGINDSIVINKVTVAIGRAPGAPAVTVRFYATTVNPSSQDTLPLLPAKLIGSLDLPAGGNSNFFTIGDGVTPLYTVAADTGFVTPNYQTLFIGLSFSDSLQTNGWYLSNGPDSNYYTAFKYDATATTDPLYSFNFYGSYNLPATFFAQVYGTFKVASTLPVTLTDFTATKAGENNVLSWKTQTEINSSKFIVERSTDGRNFTKIGEVAAAGKSSSILNYTFTDKAPTAGTNYYRLHSLDKDNSGVYSLIRSLKNAAITLFNLYPNPVIDNLNVIIEAGSQGKGIITITDFNGRQLLSHAVQYTPGNNTVKLDINNLAKGEYIVRGQLEDETFTKKFTKK